MHHCLTRHLPIIAALVMIAPRAGAQTMPRLVELRVANLVTARERVRAHDTRYAVAYDSLIAQANRALGAGPWSVMDKKLMPESGDRHDYMSFGRYWWPDSTKPNGLPYVKRDGQSNPANRVDSDAQRFADLNDAAITLALGWWFTGDARYADRAALVLRRWFVDPATRMNPSLRYAQAIPGLSAGRGIGILDLRDMSRIADAVGLIRGSASWSATDDAAMRAWCRDYLVWLRTSKEGKDERAEKNNHGSWYDEQLAAVALFVGDTALARATADHAGPMRVARQIRRDGAQPEELARTRSFTYTVFNADALSRLAEIGAHVGGRLWTYRAPNGASLRAALAYAAPYADSTRHWPGQQITRAGPDELLLPLRRAAAASGTHEFDAALTALPAASRAADRSRLLFPDAP
jgi:Alginate lyase